MVRLIGARLRACHARVHGLRRCWPPCLHRPACVQTTQSFAPRLSRALAEANMAEVAEVRRQAAAMLTLLYKQ